MIVVVVVNKRADIQANRDKSCKEDYNMRLHEFADPKGYILPDAEEAAIVQEIERCSRAYAHGDAESRLRKKQQTKEPAPLNTT
jgi:hypothetical protein